MADGTKTLAAEANGGVTLTETSTTVDLKVDGANVATASSLSNGVTFYLLMTIGGVIKKYLSPFVIDSSLNVGLGRIPGARLDVEGTVRTTGRFFSAKTLGGASGSLTYDQAKFLMYYLSDANWAGSGVNDAGSIWIRTGNATGYEFWMTNSGQFGFGTPTVTAGYKGEFNGAVKVAGNVVATGKIGVGGITAPATSIETNGIIRITSALPTLQFRDTNQANPTDIAAIDFEGGATRFSTYDASAVQAYIWLISAYNNDGTHTATFQPGTKVKIGGRIDHGVLASAPSGPAQGDHYFNSTDKFEYFYNGTEWKAAWA